MKKVKEVIRRFVQSCDTIEIVEIAVTISIVIGIVIGGSLARHSAYMDANDMLSYYGIHETIEEFYD